MLPESGVNPVLRSQQSGNLPDLFKSPFNGSFAIRVDQAAGRRRQKAAGQQEV
jgi:hypothetical protein